MAFVVSLLLHCFQFHGFVPESNILSLGCSGVIQSIGEAGVDLCDEPLAEKRSIAVSCIGISCK